MYSALMSRRRALIRAGDAQAVERDCAMHAKGFVCRSRLASQLLRRASNLAAMFEEVLNNSEEANLGTGYYYYIMIIYYVVAGSL